MYRTRNKPVQIQSNEYGRCPSKYLQSDIRKCTLIYHLRHKIRLGKVNQTSEIARRIGLCLAVFDELGIILKSR